MAALEYRRSGGRGAVGAARRITARTRAASSRRLNGLLT
jgi:hypothetical protein